MRLRVGGGLETLPERALTVARSSRMKEYRCNGNCKAASQTFQPSTTQLQLLRCPQTQTNENMELLVNKGEFVFTDPGQLLGHLTQEVTVMLCWLGQSCSSLPSCDPLPPKPAAATQGKATGAGTFMRWTEGNFCSSWGCWCQSHFTHVSRGREKQVQGGWKSRGFGGRAWQQTKHRKRGAPELRHSGNWESRGEEAAWAWS